MKYKMGEDNIAYTYSIGNLVIARIRDCTDYGLSYTPLPIQCVNRSFYLVLDGSGSSCNSVEEAEQKIKDITLDGFIHLIKTTNAFNTVREYEIKEKI